MAWRSKSKLRRNAIKHGYRSGFEHKVSEQLKENKVNFEYETTVIPYIKPETKHTYTIDFTLPNGILVETALFTAMRVLSTSGLIFNLIMGSSLLTRPLRQIYTKGTVSYNKGL